MHIVTNFLLTKLNLPQTELLFFIRSFSLSNKEKVCSNVGSWYWFAQIEIQESKLSFIWRKCRSCKLHSSTLLNFNTIWTIILYLSPNIVRLIKSRSLRWAGHVARMEEGRSALKMLTGTPAGKSPLERPRCWWEENIRMDLKEIGINTRNWVH